MDVNKIKEGLLTVGWYMCAPLDVDENLNYIEPPSYETKPETEYKYQEWMAKMRYVSYVGAIKDIINFIDNGTHTMSRELLIHNLHCILGQVEAMTFCSISLCLNDDFIPTKPLNGEEQAVYDFFILPLKEAYLYIKENMKD